MAVVPFSGAAPHIEDGEEESLRLRDQMHRRLEIYRPGRQAEVLDSPTNVSGKDTPPGFVLDLAEIFT